MSTKKYGLVLPEKGKQGPTFQASRNVFGNDSDSEEDTSKKPVLLRPSDNINRQAKVTQEKAVTEDPTVYQYDEIYDDMVSSKQIEKKKSKEDVKPRYIENLMKTANKRKIENERRIERQIQKEREKEGEEFKDKEVFVTTAYKKKLQEMREEEEKEKREEYLESIGDVTKQRDLVKSKTRWRHDLDVFVKDWGEMAKDRDAWKEMGETFAQEWDSIGGFYRHLYEQKLGSDKPQTDSNKEITAEPKKEENTTEKKSETVTTHKSDSTKKRNYRKRKSVESKGHLSDGEIEDSDEEINRLNLDDIKSAKRNKTTEENIDADSDFSIDESSDEETDKKPDEQQIQEIQEEVKALKTSETPEREIKKENDSKISDEPKIVPEVKPKVDIWKKRTVGEEFNQALKRYYERKAARAC